MHICITRPQWGKNSHQKTTMQIFKDKIWALIVYTCYCCAWALHFSGAAAILPWILGGCQGATWLNIALLFHIWLLGNSIRGTDKMWTSMKMCIYHIPLSYIVKVGQNAKRLTDLVNYKVHKISPMGNLTNLDIVHRCIYASLSLSELKIAVKKTVMHIPSSL